MPTWPAPVPDVLAPQPYKSTPVFSETTLPAGLRREHRTKVGVWGIVRILDGEVILKFADGTPEQRLTPAQCGLLLPDQPHWVEPVGAMHMQVDFYDRHPDFGAAERTH